MGNVDVPTSGSQVVKMAIGTYEFGANLVTNKGNLMLGRITGDGRLTGRVKCVRLCMCKEGVWGTCVRARARACRRAK
jgi:hypothetical protein